MEIKAQIRKAYKAKRQEMPETEVVTASEKICEVIASSGFYQTAERIGFYYPLGKEADCLDFLEKALHDGKHVALPRTGAGCTMEFYEITSLTQTAEGAFHVMEPTTACHCINPMDLCNQQITVLVPGVVFDLAGSRYGYGKGFYDRYLARYAKLNRFALAYENQLVSELETLDTDVKMDRIYTEENEYKII